MLRHWFSCACKITIYRCAIHKMWLKKQKKFFKLVPFPQTSHLYTPFCPAKAVGIWLLIPSFSKSSTTSPLIHSTTLIPWASQPSAPLSFSDILHFPWCNKLVLQFCSKNLELFLISSHHSWHQKPKGVDWKVHMVLKAEVVIWKINASNYALCCCWAEDPAAWCS